MQNLKKRYYDKISECSEEETRKSIMPILDYKKRSRHGTFEELSSMEYGLEIHTATLECIEVILKNLESGEGMNDSHEKVYNIISKMNMKTSGKIFSFVKAMLDNEEKVPLETFPPDIIQPLSFSKRSTLK
jgi:hypothetical protein